MRAADGGYATRFLAFFVALGCSRFDGESTLPPTAANADRVVLNVSGKSFFSVGEKSETSEFKRENI